MKWVTKYEAPWCTSCKQMAPALKKLVDDGVIGLNVIDISVNPQAAQAAGVRSVPTLIVYESAEDEPELGRFYSVSPNFLESINVKQE